MKALTDGNEIKKFFSRYSKLTVKTFIEIVAVVVQVRNISLLIGIVATDYAVAVQKKYWNNCKNLLQ